MMMGLSIYGVAVISQSFTPDSTYIDKTLF